MAYVVQENRLGQSRIGSIDTTPSVPLGTMVEAADPTYGSGTFVYLKGVASTAVGDAVVYDTGDHSTTRTVANSKGPVAWATAATVADTYGWYHVRGVAVAKVAASFADTNAVYLTSTPGTVDDAVVAGDRVIGAIAASAIDTPSTGLALININFPHADDIAD